MVPVMLGWFLVVIVMIFGWLAVPTAAADASCVVEADHPLIGEARWYGLYFEDRKIGHASTAMAIEEQDDPGVTSNVIVQRFAMTFKLEQTEETIEKKVTSETPPIESRFSVKSFLFNNLQWLVLGGAILFLVVV